MQRALALAAEAARDGEVPVGAVVTQGGKIIGEGVNRTRRDLDPSAHAEIVAIRASCKALGSDRLIGCELWVTLEPCPMCAGAIAHARFDRLIYAAPDPKGGGVDHGARVFAQPTCHHRPQVLGGVGESAAAILLKDFFATLR
jgi:tRNA(adenine34) deaminase